jgi:monoamine oxidase
MTLSATTARLRERYAAHAEAERRGMPVDEVLGEREERRAGARRQEREREAGGLTRRSFLASSGAAIVAAGLPGRLAAAGPADPRIVIVGAGLAGIRCAHRLATEKRIASTVYEADTTHLGGRCWSLRGYFSHGLVAEHGGSFVNSDQRATRDLAKKLGLEEEVVNGGDLLSGEEVYWANGGTYSYADANADWGNAFAAFRDAYKAAPWPQRYNSSTAEARRLDNLSVPEWLDEIGVGAGSRFGQLMQSNTLSEYGGPPSDQASLNLLYLLAWNSRTSLQPLTGDDEKFHIVGGSDQIVSRMLSQLPPGSVRQGYELVALRRNGDGSYTCTFDAGGSTVGVQADHVVLALPFSTLRDVDLSQAGLSPLKMLAIQTLGMGQNAKVHVEVARKTWPPLGYSGVTYTGPDGYQVAWDDSVQLGPEGAPAILLVYPGGDVARTRLTGAAHGPAPKKDVNWLLGQVDNLFPGTGSAYTGRAYEDHWSMDPWHRGAYSYWRVGQYTTISGYESLQEANVHFAGEHTDPEDQGFLNGAVVSGERAAGEIARQV